MPFNLIPMTRSDERLDENDAGPTEYLLTKLSNLTILLCIEGSQHIKPIIATMFRGVIKDLENNKSTQFMFNNTTLFQTTWTK